MGANARTEVQLHENTNFAAGAGDRVCLINF